MQYLRFHTRLNFPWRKQMIVVLYLILVATFLASCGTASTATPAPKQAAIPTATSTPEPTSTPVPTLAPTPTPTPTPIPPAPTQPPPAPTQAPPPPQPPAPAILDLQPASMSFVGHLDCRTQDPTIFVCVARVLSRVSNQSNLNWSAFTNVPGRISFSPVSGVLAPGQSVLVRITIPTNACTRGLFFFRGPINTHTITWAC